MRIDYISGDDKFAVWLDLPEDLTAKANQMQDAGFHFELEMLPKGFIDASVQDRIHEVPLGFVICKLDEAEKAFTRLITNFNMENPYV